MIGALDAYPQICVCPPMYRYLQNSHKSHWNSVLFFHCRQSGLSEVCHELSISEQCHGVLQWFLGSGLPSTEYPFTPTGPEPLPQLLGWPQYFFSDWDVSNSHAHCENAPHDVLPQRVMHIHVPLHLLGIHMKVTWRATRWAQKGGWKELWQPHKV